MAKKYDVSDFPEREVVACQRALIEVLNILREFARLPGMSKNAIYQSWKLAMAILVAVVGSTYWGLNGLGENQDEPNTTNTKRHQNQTRLSEYQLSTNGTSKVVLPAPAKAICLVIFGRRTSDCTA